MNEDTTRSRVVFKKSSYSSGGQNCVEISLPASIGDISIHDSGALTMSDTANGICSQAGWIKSTYSNGVGGECVEAATLADGTAVRDSKHPSGPALAFPGAVWATFITGIRRNNML